MHRSTPRRALAAAAALTATICFTCPAPAEPGDGTLGANHEAAIKIALPASLDEDAPSPSPIADEPVAPVDPAIEAEAARERSESNRTNDERELPLGEDHDAVNEAVSQLSATLGASSQQSDEQSIGLVNPNDGEAEQRSSPLAFLPGGDSDIIQVISALAIVVTLLLVFRFVMVRASGALAGGRPSGVLEVLVRYPVARGQHLSLIKLGRRILLVHQAGSSMTMLSEVSQPEEVAGLLSRIEAGSSGRDADRFRTLLNQYRREHDAADARISVDAETKRGGVRESSHDAQGEIVDLTRSQMGGLRNLFGNGGGKR